MQKRIVNVLTAIICCMGVFSAVGCGEADNGSESKGVAKVWAALSSEVIVQDILPETYPEAKLDFAAIKGETESMQIMITANESIRGIEIETADLTDGNGDVISKDSIKLYGEHYVEMTEHP